MTNWRDIGGKDLPIRLISRNPGSGTRAAFQRRVLGGAREPGSNSDDCRNRDPGFLRYLTNQVGADIVRSHGDRPCAELANPQLCRPT